MTEANQDIPPSLEEITERVTHGAEEIAGGLDQAGPKARPGLIAAVKQTLEPKGVGVTDLHEAMQKFPELDPTSLPNVTGRTGKTREQVLANVAMRPFRRKRR